MPRRLQGQLGPIVLVAAVAAMLAGCDTTTSDGTDYVAVCTDHAGNRVDDSKCDRAPAVYDNDGFDAGDAFLWYYLGTANSSAYAPGIGQRVVGGVWRTPVSVRNTTINIGSGNTKSTGGTTKQTVQRGGVPTSGGSITRGGFGVSSGSSGGAKSSSGSSTSSGGRSSSGSAGS